jgi:hypothetical protein
MEIYLLALEFTAFAMLNLWTLGESKLTASVQVVALFTKELATFSSP